MENFAVAAVVFAFFAGIALVFHGFHVVTIHKHYHGKKDGSKEEEG